MINFKYTDPTNTVVFFGNESWLVTAPHVQRWLSEGNTPESADPLPPPPPKQFTSLEFLDLFTAMEQLAVVSAAMASPQVKLWYDRMLAAGYVTVSDPRTEAGLSALVQAGLLEESRKLTILTQMQ